MTKWDLLVSNFDDRACVFSGDRQETPRMFALLRAITLSLICSLFIASDTASANVTKELNVLKESRVKLTELHNISF
jgi:hypothetical protein